MLQNVSLYMFFLLRPEPSLYTRGFTFKVHAHIKCINLTESDSPTKNHKNYELTERGWCSATKKTYYCYHIPIYNIFYLYNKDTAVTHSFVSRS